MKLCYFADASSIHTLRWVSFFAKRGHEVHLITFEEPISGYDRVKIYKLQKSGLSPLMTLLTQLWHIRSLVRGISPDIAHAHYTIKYGIFPALLNFHPFVLTPWGSDLLIYPETSAIGRLLTGYILSKADLITCDGDNLTRIMRRFGVPASLIKRIYFGVDTSVFKPTAKAKSNRRLTVISLRSLKPIYNVDLLLRAIPRVVKQNPHVRFLIAGGGSQKQELVRLAKRLRIGRYVEFIGHISPEKLPSLLSSADIYVSTSLSDSGLAASTAEAMASELPIVITDSGDNKKILQESNAGLLVPVGDAPALANGLIALLKSKKKREEYGKNGRAFIRKQQDYNTEMSKMEKVYKTLLK